MLKGFKEFILRGNVIDLAVAVVIGASFTAIVTALVNGVFNPVITLLFDASDLAAAGWTIRGEAGAEDAVTISYGLVLSAVIQFILVAAVVYFALIVPMNYLAKRASARKDQGEPAVAEYTPPTELELLTDIRNHLAALNGAPVDRPHEGDGAEASGKHV